MAVCPKCKHFYFENRGALSRRDNKTEICPQCGYKEATEDWENYLKSKGVNVDGNKVI